MIRFQGQVWHIAVATGQNAAIAPAQSPEGRFHHSGQWALYTSLTLEGAGVAIAAYLAQDARDRVAIAMNIDARVIALRALPDPTAASVVWQTDRAHGRPAPTWAFSDAARAQGAEGVLYPSRSRPELTHLTLFTPNAVCSWETPIPWSPMD